MFAPEAGALVTAATTLELAGDRFDPSAAIRSVNHIVALGRDAVLQRLRSDAATAARGAAAEHVLVLCRLAFAPEEGQTLPPLLIGLPDVAPPPGAEVEWPLFPLALVDDVPFVLVRGYLRGGLAQTPAEHVEACATTCDVRSQPLAPGSPLAAADVLLRSSAWRRLAAANAGAEDTARILRRQALRAVAPALAGEEVLDAARDKRFDELKRAPFTWDADREQFVRGDEGA
jgi:hypothetical protein